MDTNTTKTFSWKAAIFLFFGVGLLSAGLSVFFQARSATMQDIPAADSKPVAVALAPVDLGSAFEVPAGPARLIIPAIGVDAVIQSVGLSPTGDGDMGVPTNFTDVAWYSEGPVPGMPGSAVIDGHLDGRNVPKAVFYDIGNLKPGDLVEVVDQRGRTLSFRVVDSKAYDYNATTSDIFSGDASKARLNLITCAGDWIKSRKLYDKRVVVFTELVTTASF